MKTTTLRSQRSPRRTALSAMLVTVLGFAWPLHGQSFDAGSDGSLGDMIISSNTTMNLPADGKLHFRSLTVNGGSTLRFNRNARNTPVFILSQTEVVVNGTINIDGGARPVNTGGLGGPGGFDGGKSGFGAEVPPGAGYGPGAGASGNSGSCTARPDVSQAGSFGSLGLGAASGSTYGNTLLIPLVGGSGDGGGQGSSAGGGGGGGAILIAANNRVAISGSILARGGLGGTCNNAGNGGGIRLVSFKVEGAGTLDCDGGNTPNRGFGTGGNGRVRIDTVIRTGLNFNITGVSSVGGNLLVFPPTVATLNVIEAAGNAEPLGSDPVVFTLPFGSTTNRIIRIQAQDFARNVPIRVTLTPDTGVKRVFDADVDNTTVNPAVVDVPVTVPVNTLVTVHCWTR